MVKRLIAAVKHILSQENRLDIRNIKYLPRWAILGIDISIICLAGAPYSACSSGSHGQVLYIIVHAGKDGDGDSDQHHLFLHLPHLCRSY